jgi:hypothetical protein
MSPGRRVSEEQRESRTFGESRRHWPMNPEKTREKLDKDSEPSSACGNCLVIMMMKPSAGLGPDCELISARARPSTSCVCVASEEIPVKLTENVFLIEISPESDAVEIFTRVDR